MKEMHKKYYNNIFFCEAVAVDISFECLRYCSLGLQRNLNSVLHRKNCHRKNNKTYLCCQTLSNLEVAT